MIRRTWLRLVPIVTCLALAACATAQPPAAVPGAAVPATETAPLSLIPQVASLERRAGRFDVTAQTPLVVAAGDASAKATAQWLAGQIRASRSLALPLVEGASGTAAIRFVRDPSITGDEAYRLDVAPDGVRIAARTDAGLFYGAVTFWQVLTSAPGTSVPALHVSDAPRFAWRGLMLDSVRHIQTTGEIRTLIDQMALHKLNTLHWHLADDQGWRIEIKRYPEFTRVGAWRTPPDAGHDGEPERYGGFYTQAQIRAMVAYAAARHITIVPEIDLPGHAQAAVASYPRLGVTGKRVPVSVDWGVNTTLYNPDPASIRMIEGVLDEVMALFPSRYIHLGGDEAVKDQWQASTAVQAQIRRLGLKDEEALQGWMMGRLGDYLAAHGRRMIGWDEILDGRVPPNATVMSWRGTKGAITAAQKGHDVVLSPAPDLYLDQLQSARADETTGRLPVKSLHDYYLFEPVPAELTADQARHVLGAQANVWAEHMPTFAHIEHAVFPRLDALAEVDWTPVARHDWKGFLARLPAQFARYRAAGIGYADSAYAPDIGIDDDAALATGKATVTLGNQVQDGAIHYTVDGSAPGLDAPLYRMPFPVTLPVTVRAATFAPDGSALAAPRTRVIDRAALLTRSGHALVNCPGSEFRLRVQPMPDATSLAPVYTLPLFNSCQQWPAAPVEGMQSLHVKMQRLVNNYALAHEAKLVVSRKRQTPFGELVVHADSCEGATVARWVLPDPSHAPRTLSFDATLKPMRGRHDLCFVVTAPIHGPLYVFGHVALVPGARP